MIATTAIAARTTPFRDRHLAAPSRLGLQRLERDIGHGRAGGVRIDDRLVHRPEHLLHRLQIHALAGHAGRLLVLVVDLVVAGGLALGLEDRLLAIGLGLGNDAGSAALGLRHDLVGVGLRFVDGALLILLRCGHVAIGGKDLARGVDRLQLNLLHENASPIRVEQVLHPLLHVGLDRRPVGGENAVDGLQADDLAHDALGHRLDRLARAENVEHVIFGLGRVDLPVHPESERRRYSCPRSASGFLRECPRSPRDCDSRLR